MIAGALLFVRAGLVLAACGLAGCGSKTAPLDEAKGVASATAFSVHESDDRLEIRKGDRAILTYRYGGVSRPFFHPVLAPGGAELTRRWPILEAAPGEEKDHPHQKSLWFAHGAVNGHDFWIEGKNAGRIVQKSIVHELADEASVRVWTTNDWVASDGSRVMTDHRVIDFAERGGRRYLDFAVKMLATDGDLVFGDTKEGTMAFRVTPSLRVVGPVAKGHLQMDTGLRDGEAWGTRAAWLHAQGPALGAPDTEASRIGVVIFDHPSNLRHPTWWHARTYGLLAANPFGIHDFTKPSKDPQPRGSGRYELAAGRSLTLRYRFLLHRGTLEAADIQTEYDAYAQATKIEVEEKSR